MQRRGEILAFKIRMADGISCDEATPWSATMHEFQRLDFLSERDGRIALTRRGRLMADSVAEIFV